MNSRGSILVQVLIMGVLLLLLVTMLIRAVVQHYQLGTMAVESARSEELAQTAIQAVNAAWANPTCPGTTCSNCTSGTVAVSCPASPSCTVIINGTSYPSICNCAVTIGGTPYPSVCVATVSGNPTLQVTRQYP